MKKMITPADLQQKVIPMPVSGKYDWEKQTYSFDACKWGTTRLTNSSTCSGQYSTMDDSNNDNISD